MSGTLRSRTARSALFLLRENMKDLRQYTAEFDPAEIDRISKAAELVSTSLKKLQAWVAEAPTNTKNSKSDLASDTIDVAAVAAFLTTLETGRLCLVCGGVLPRAK